MAPPFWAIVRNAFAAVDRIGAPAPGSFRQGPISENHLDRTGTKEIGVSDANVEKAIETLNIEPVGKRGICKLYAADVVATIRKTLA